jgi:hypothetical protein
MRFAWIAEQICDGIRYELYRPGRKYAGVVFVKSMDWKCVRLLEKLNAHRVATFYDVNVDYFTSPQGNFRYPSMRASSDQRERATAMACGARAVLTSSRYLATIAGSLNSATHWLPDNVPMHWLKRTPKSVASLNTPIALWWSGVSLKLFELLAIKDTLLRYRDRVHLHLVTSALSLTKQWETGLRENFQTLLAQVPHTFHRFTSIPALLRLYSNAPGFVISPRFLDNNYNLAHSEWKITLGMGAGLPALCSPQPSYLDVQAAAAPGAVQISNSTADWDEIFETVLSGGWNHCEKAAAARDVVERNYSTEKIAANHRRIVEQHLS